MLKNFCIHYLVIFIILLSLTACCPQQQTYSQAPANISASHASPSVMYGSTCGNNFPAYDWLEGSQYAYEILDKRNNGSGYKVKILKNVNGEMTHIVCAHGLQTPREAYDWLRNAGYTFQAESFAIDTGHYTDHNYTVISRGVILTLPPYIK
jgi:hypothetical protein